MTKVFRKFIWVKCPKCEFSNGGFYEGDITPTRPMSFICKRDRDYDEKAKHMVQASCNNQWDVVVTEEEYLRYFKNMGKTVVMELLEGMEE